jgi:hypothetical protein
MIVAILTLISRLKRRTLALAGIIIALMLITGAYLAPAYAADIPSDDEQDVLIRSTLASLNDANMTGNYAVFFAKASKQFQEQVSMDKLASGAENFRQNKLFFESIVTDDYASYDKAVINQQGALVLAGVFKGDAMQVTYNLQFVQNDNEWKLLGFTVNAKKI